MIEKSESLVVAVLGCRNIGKTDFLELWRCWVKARGCFITTSNIIKYKAE